jgi:hypothetical protein
MAPVFPCPAVVNSKYLSLVSLACGKRALDLYMARLRRHALTAMREDGTYRRIYEKWFGSEVQGNN